MRRLGVAGGALVAGVWLACSGGGGSVGSGGTPEDRCGQFLTLNNECYARAGRPSPTTVTSCSGVPLDESALAQIDCALENASGYCKIIQLSVGDAGRYDLNDPELRALNACYSRRRLVSPCKEAFDIVDGCGGQIGFSSECTGTFANLATCIRQHPAGACQLYGRREAGAPVNTPEIQALQKCQQDAQRRDGG